MAGWTWSVVGALVAGLLWTAGTGSAFASETGEEAVTDGGAAAPSSGGQEAAETIPEVPAGTEPTPRPWPSRLGPVTVGTDDGRAAVRLGLVGQIRAQATVPTSGEREVAVKGWLKRFRVTVDGRFLQRRLRIKTQLNAVPGKTELLDLFVEGRVHEAVRLRLGWYKTPFTRYRDQSFAGLAMADWALTTRAFGSERQLALMAHDDGEDGLRWAAAVGTGANSRANHGMGIVDAYATPVGNPSAFVDPASVNELHPEVFARVGWTAEGTGVTAPHDRDGSRRARGGAWLSATWDARPDRGEDHALRLAPEGLLQVAGVQVMAVGYAGWALDGDGNWFLAQLGGLGTVSWHVHHHLELAVRYAVVSRTEALARDVAAVGNEGGRGQGVEQEVGLGWSVPVVGQDLIWQSDVRYVVDRTVGQGTEADVVVRSTLQLGF